MAVKRMFSTKVIDTDLFLDMPMSAQCLYFQFGMRADDDGFIDKPKSIMRITGCKDDDFKILVAKSFIIPFESGIIVIKHWRINNYLRSDRYHPTNFQEEIEQLSVNENGEYEFGIPSGTPLGTISKSNSLSLSLKDLKDLKDNNIKDDIKDINNEKPYKEICDYLNGKAKTSYRSTTNTTRKRINARFADGFTLDDFKTVIDKKCKDWLGGEMESYLIPETLFGTKFESYLNQNIITNQKQPKIQSPKQDASQLDLDKGMY